MAGNKCIGLNSENSPEDEASARFGTPTSAGFTIVSANQSSSTATQPLSARDRPTVPASDPLLTLIQALVTRPCLQRLAGSRQSVQNGDFLEADSYHFPD